MARGIKLAGWVKPDNSSINFPNRAKITRLIERLEPGTKVWLRIDEDETEHIKSHRGYYWAVVVLECAKAFREVSGYPIDHENKNDLEDVHEWLKNEFLNNSKEVKNNQGKTLNLPPSTKRLDDEGWKDYLNRIICFAADFWRWEIPRKLPRYVLPEAEDEPKVY